MRLQLLLLFALAIFIFTAHGLYAQCNASFNSTATTVCSGNVVNFINTSTSNSTNSWKINEVQFSAGVNSSYLFPAVGNYNVELVISDGMGCLDSSTVVITVNQTPTVNISVSATTLWASDSVYVNFTSSGTVGGAFYYWDFCDGNTSPAASPFYYQWAAPGTTYCVCVELDNNNGCSDADCEINIVVNDDLGAAEHTAENFVIFPNPTSGSFTIDGLQDFRYIVVSDQLGRTVARYDNLDAFSSFAQSCSLPAGIYFVKIAGPENEVVRQLVIE